MKESFDDLVEVARARLLDTPGPLTPHRVAHALRAGQEPIGDETVLAVHETLRREIEGVGLLQPLLARPGVTDVLVNGAHQIWVDDGDGLQLTDVQFRDDHGVRRLAQRLAASAGRRLDDAAPWVDVRLPDGTRLHAVLAPLARPGTTISLRIPSRESLSLDDLHRQGALTDLGLRVLRLVIRRRVPVVISGGTSPDRLIGR